MISSNAATNMEYNKGYLRDMVFKNPQKYPNSRIIYERPKEFLFDLREFAKNLSPQELDYFESNFNIVNQELCKDRININDVEKFANWWEKIATEIKASPSFLAKNKIKLFKDAMENPREYATTKFVLSGKARFYDKFINFQDTAGLDAASRVKAGFAILKDKITSGELAEEEIKNLSRQIRILCETIRMK